MVDRSPTGWIGTVLSDKWKIEARIARGGVATVYRATHRQGQKAAIKIMHPELARNEDVRRRFLREGYVANKVDHPGVVAIIDDDVTDGGTAYIVMELLEGGELLEDRRERLGGKLPVAEAIDIMMQVLDVLASAHEKGIIHRDIKPDNIYVLGDGTVKLLDFGIAHMKEEARAQEPTATGHLLGTPDYMSPEQALGKRGQIDAQTDVYAVGATLFTLLSGEAVHPSETLAALIMAISANQARSLSTAVKDAPKEIIEVVDKALAMDKSRRWKNAREMQDGLLAAKSKMAPPPQRSKSVLPVVAPPPRPSRAPPQPEKLPGTVRMPKITKEEQEEEEAPSSAATLIKAPPPMSIREDASPPTEPFARAIDSGSVETPRTAPEPAPSITQIQAAAPITPRMEDDLSAAETVAAIAPPVAKPVDLQLTAKQPVFRSIQTPPSMPPMSPPPSVYPQPAPFMPWPPQQQPMQQRPSQQVPPIVIVAIACAALVLFALFVGTCIVVRGR